MEKRNLLLSCLLFIAFNVNAQIKIDTAGKVMLGTYSFGWNEGTLNILGSGTYASGGSIGFGDNSSSTKNVMIGEYTGDSDELLLHGKNGLRFSTSNSFSTKVFLNNDGDLGIGTTSPDYKLEVSGGAIQIEDPSGYPYGMSISTTYSSAWTREYSISRGTAKKLFCFGARGDDDDLTYGYIGGSTTGNTGWDNPWMLFDDDGDVGINTYPYPGFMLSVYGDVCGTSWEDSDSTLKRDIKRFDETFSNNLLKLNGYSYKMKTKNDILNIKFNEREDSVLNVESEKEIEYANRTRVGLIAQEVKQYYPDLVKENENGIMALYYDGFIPIIIEAMKEQQNSIEEQQSTIEALEAQLTELNEIVCNCPVIGSSNLKSNSTDISENTSTSNMLYQNIPNPFNQNTEIKFFIENEAQNANIYIYNLQGIQINSYSISDRGNSSIIINSSELQAGVYLYTLIVDGQEVDTKKMILTE